MNTTQGSTRTAGFSAHEATEAMRDAMHQIKASFDKRVGTRMGRGDVRQAVLALLHEQPMHGYQVIREITERTEGRWKPSAGSVYPTLQQLADEGLVRAETVQDRKIYSLTDAAKVEATTAAASAPWTIDDDCETSGFKAVSKAGLDLAQAASQVVRTGTTEQQEEAVEVLHDARRRLYAILSRD